MPLIKKPFKNFERLFPVPRTGLQQPHTIIFFALVINYTLQVLAHYYRRFCLSYCTSFFFDALTKATIESAIR
jgi:hypothetical protein